MLLWIRRMNVSCLGGKRRQGVFIYLNKAPKGGKSLEAPEEPFLFDQKNCRFFPHCVVIPCGQTGESSEW